MSIPKYLVSLFSGASALTVSHLLVRRLSSRPTQRLTIGHATRQITFSPTIVAYGDAYNPPTLRQSTMSQNRLSRFMNPLLDNLRTARRSIENADLHRKCCPTRTQITLSSYYLVSRDSVMAVIVFIDSSNLVRIRRPDIVSCIMA
ncbi:hypothetical protein NEOLEDRAFT_193874 [Neolentinus lepideus HHB14362 ss-1]|uniref:Uncharacterized protein n=1 Tax=Neolentinus lepideus HHB14362 ss-1 TaxID=1314782 RepID=A0A165MFG8_9AGAM|nr:hypothetical protein NEOLEDRAFT_193874 [Neolentinus lepideus HHB14362 ss-1]